MFGGGRHADLLQDKNDNNRNDNNRKNGQGLMLGGYNK